MPRQPAADRNGTHPAPAAGRADRGGIGRKRREQIVDAAIAIIATEGIHKLSLGNLERRVQMTRGHLTYYFRTKEDILLAVFDRMLHRMMEGHAAAGGPLPMTGRAWECARQGFARAVGSGGPDPAFVSLIHTFHAQMGFRPDFRQKIAEANAGWRGLIAADYADTVPDPPVRPAVAASLVMALIQGLSGQLAVDPEAFDRDEMLAAVTALVAPLFRTKGTKARKGSRDE